MKTNLHRTKIGVIYIRRVKLIGYTELEPIKTGETITTAGRHNKGGAVTTREEGQKNSE